MITAQIESLTAVWPELEPHFPEHWKELAMWTDKVPLDVNRARYFDIDAQGKFTLATAREDGRLVGYANFLVDTHLHYQSTLFASMDVIYLAPEHRGNGTGFEMGRVLLAELRRRGVGPMIAGSKNHKAIAGFWRALGMEPFEEYFGMWIGD